MHMTTTPLETLDANPSDECLDAYTQGLIDGRRNREHLFTGDTLEYYRLGRRDADPAMGGDADEG